MNVPNGAFILRIREYRHGAHRRYTGVFDHVPGAYHGNNPLEVERRAVQMLNSAFLYMASVVHVMMVP